MFRRRLTAQQNCRQCKLRPVQRRLDLARRHQVEKTALVVGPASAVLFVVVQQRLGWGQQRLVGILDAAQILQEIGQIAVLGKARKLRGVVETHVKKALDPGVGQSSEKVGGGALGEAD